jgi:hypothetical protein
VYQKLEYGPFMSKGNRQKKKRQPSKKQRIQQNAQQAARAKVEKAASRQQQQIPPVRARQVCPWGPFCSAGGDATFKRGRSQICQPDAPGCFSGSLRCTQTALLFLGCMPGIVWLCRM